MSEGRRVAEEEEPPGGDPACWLDRVCPECGTFLEEGPHSCPGSPPDTAPR
jgi:hypothetical protein